MFALFPPHTGDVAAPLTCPREEDGARQGPGGETDYTDTMTHYWPRYVLQEENQQPRPPLSLFPNLYYPPGSEGGGGLYISVLWASQLTFVISDLSGMLSQVLMSLSARHHRHPHHERLPGLTIKVNKSTILCNFIKQVNRNLLKYRIMLNYPKSLN